MGIEIKKVAVLKCDWCGKKHEGSPPYLVAPRYDLDTGEILENTAPFPGNWVVRGDHVFCSYDEHDPESCVREWQAEEARLRGA